MMRKMGKARRIACVLMAAMCLLLLCSGCGKANIITDAKYFDMSAYNTDLPIPFEIEFTTGEIVSGELYYDNAPITVGNFVTLCNDGYYDNTIIYRVLPDQLIQGGCKDGTGRSHLDYSIRGEFSDNGWNNQLHHERGTLSMAQFGNDPNSAGSHFFICTDNQYNYNGKYAAFGTVKDGMAFVDKIAGSELGEDGKRPVEDFTIKTIRILDNN